MELAPGPKGADEHPALLSLPESDQAKPVSLSFLLFFQRKRGACKPGVSDPQHPEALPEIEVKNAMDEEFALGSMELPGTSLECFLKGLTEGALGKGDPFYGELYSWYLRSPKYRELARKLVEASMTRRPSDVISKSVAKVLYGEVSPLQCYQAGTFFRLCICPFSPVWPEPDGACRV